MNKAWSIRQQRAYGTLERNKLIRLSRKHGAGLAEIGKTLDPKVSRQRIFQICEEL